MLWSLRNRDRQRFSILQAPQCKIAKTLYILLSTVNDISKTFRKQSGEISVHTGQGQNQCCICDLWALRQHCIQNRNSVTEIAAWAQERSVCEHQQMLRRSSEDMIQKGSHLLQPNAHLMWNEAKWKCVLCQTYVM